MKNIIISVFFLAFSTLVNAQEEVINQDVITVYYLVRHAEKDRTNPKDKNPNLTTEGKIRAEKWKHILSNVSFDLVYATNYVRTQQTAMPMAEHHNVSIIIYEANNLVNPDFLEATKGKKVFIVGHSNSVPATVNKLIGQNKYQNIDDSENGSLFIVTKIGNSVSEQLLIIN